MANDDPERDEMGKSSFASRKRKATASEKKSRKGKGKGKGVSGRNATEVNPLQALDSNADSPDPELFTETTGPGPIPSELKNIPEIRPLDFDTERVNVRNLWPSRIIVRNTPSGEAYNFDEAGRILSVRNIDVQYLLNFNSNGTRGCCGSSGEKRKFEIV